ENRQPRCDAPDVEPRARLLDELLVAARSGGRLEDTVRVVRQALVRSEEANQRVEPIVVWLQIVIADRPVVAEAIQAAAAKVIGAEAERQAAPVVRTAAEHPR